MGNPPATQRPKVTLNTLSTMYKKSEPITMLTAYDFPSAHVADHAGMDMVLVGDSLAMVSMGLEDTSEVTIDEMIMCCRSVARAVQSSFTVCPLVCSVYDCPC
jgi:3-methyl-2-oxobutanoate hydroxymethyltransferase